MISLTMNPNFNLMQLFLYAYRWNSHHGTYYRYTKLATFYNDCSFEHHYCIPR